VLLLVSAESVSGQTPLIDSLLRIVAAHPRDTNEIRALDRLAVEFMRKDMDQAKSYIYQQIALAKVLETDFGLAPGYSGLVALHQTTGRIDSAKYYLDQLEILAQNPANKKAAINYANSAGLFYKNQGKIKEALPYLLDALRLLENGDKTARAGQLLNVGNAYYNLGELKNAADYHLKALTLFEEVKNKRGQSFCLNSLGNDYMDLKQYAVAEKYILQSESLKEELGDKRGLLNSWMGLGIVYQQTNRADLSMLYFDKALVRARELKLVLEEARALFNIGSLLKQTKKNDASTQTFSEALTLARQIGDSSLVSRIKTYLIALQNDKLLETKEEQTLLHNIKISGEAGSIDNTAEAHLMLAEWYASRKQFDKAYENLKQGQQLTDSIKGNKVILQLKKLEEEYNTEKKEKEIALLKKDQELQTLALSRQRVIITLGIIALISILVIGALLVNRYRVMNRTKRMVEIEKVRNHIARDLHDDIGSTLSSINIMSQLALQENGNAGTHLKKIANHSARMMENMSDIVWSINPKNDSLEQVVMKMKEFAAEILEPKNIDYSFEIADSIMALTLDVEKRKNIFLIFKEAINNAAKYSEGDKLTVSLSVQQQKLSLSVRDNGKGFNPALGTMGNGLKNMEDRAVAMHGKMTRISEPGKGTDIQLEMPLT
jgi:signal transduction histidine kinase